MNDIQTLFLCCLAFAGIAIFSLIMWAGAKRRVMLLNAENAALRAQIPTRGAGGKFAPKTPK